MILFPINAICCLFQGKAISKSLHTQSNCNDSSYQRFIRIFSLQIKEQPIEITMKQMFTFNYVLLKSVSLYSIVCLAIRPKINRFIHAIIITDNCIGHNIRCNTHTISNIRRKYIWTF